MTNRRAAAQSLAWSAVESGGLSGLMLITAIVLARLVGPAEFGVAALALGIVQLLNLLVELFFHDAILQRRHIEEAHLDTALWTSMGLAVLLVSGCWVFAPWLAGLFDEPSLGPVLGWMSLSLLFSGASGVLIASFRRDMRFKPVALRTLYGRLCGAAVGIAMAVLGFGVWSLVAQNVISTVVAAFWVWANVTRLPRLQYSFTSLRELLGFSVTVFLTQFVVNANLRLFSILIGYLLGVTAFGYFSIAMKLVETCKFMITSAISHVALVLFSRLQHDKARLRRAFTQATELSAVVALPIFTGLAVTAPELVRLVLGPQWHSAIPLVQIMALGAAVALLRLFPTVVYKALGRPQINLYGNLGWMAVSLGALMLFGAYGLLAVTVIWSGRHLFALPVSTLVLRRILGLGVLEQFKGAGVPILAAALMAASVLAAKAWLVAGWSDILILTTIAPLGAAVYVGTVALITPRLAGQLLALVREMVRKSPTPAEAPPEETRLG